MKYLSIIILLATIQATAQHKVSRINAEHSGYLGASSFEKVGSLPEGVYYLKENPKAIATDTMSGVITIASAGLTYSGGYLSRSLDHECGHEECIRSYNMLKSAYQLTFETMKMYQGFYMSSLEESVSTSKTTITSTSWKTSTIISGLKTICKTEIKSGKVSVSKPQNAALAMLNRK